MMNEAATINKIKAGPGTCGRRTANPPLPPVTSDDLLKTQAGLLGLDPLRAFVL